MSNINDYLFWRGDIPMSHQFQFNEIDSMILARFSYLPFDKIKMSKKETIASISDKMKEIPDKDFMYNGDKQLITYLGQSKRFKDMFVTDYIENNDKEIEKQFCVITIHLSEKEIYISYMGTAYTIYAWKEDFNMAFMDNVPCQIEGKEYLEEMARKYSKKKIRIGGHSKGGNIAIYAAITVPKEIQKKIIKVYNYDGPGFNQSIIDKYGNDKIIDKIETYIPQDSVVGRLLNHREKMTVTLSIEKGILQHDIFSWQIEKDDLICLEKNTEISENIDKALTNWLETTTSEQRRIVVDAVFEILYSTEAETFGEMSRNLSSNVSKILKKYGEIEKENKEMIINNIKIIVTSYMNVVYQREAIKRENKKEEYVIKGKRKIEELDKKYLSRFRNSKMKKGV